MFLAGLLFELYSVQDRLDFVVGQSIGLEFFFVGVLDEVDNPEIQNRNTFIGFGAEFVGFVVDEDVILVFGLRWF